MSYIIPWVKDTATIRYVHNEITKRLVAVLRDLCDPHTLRNTIPLHFSEERMVLRKPMSGSTEVVREAGRLGIQKVDCWPSNQ